MVILTGPFITGGSEVMVLDGCATGGVFTSSPLLSQAIEFSNSAKNKYGTNRIVSFLKFVSATFVMIQIVFVNDDVYGHDCV